MNQESREKIALIAFTIAVVVFFIAVISYMSLSHSWNIAARSIDERRGAMEGYTAFVYAGNQDPVALEEARAAAEDLDSQESLDAESSANSGEESAEGETQGDSEPQEAGQTSLEPVTVQAVVNSYRDKGASVLVLNSLDPYSYEGDDIFYVGGKRVGVFYAYPGMSLMQLIQRVDFFHGHDVDFLICLTEDSGFIRYKPMGIDAVLDLSLPEFDSVQQDPSRTVFAQCPVNTHVGAILLSPDGVVSAKELSKEPSVKDPS